MYRVFVVSCRGYDQESLVEIFWSVGTVESVRDVFGNCASFGF